MQAEFDTKKKSTQCNYSDDKGTFTSLLGIAYRRNFIGKI